MVWIFQNLVRVSFSARFFKKSGLGRGYYRRMLSNFSVMAIPFTSKYPVMGAVSWLIHPLLRSRAERILFPMGFPLRDRRHDCKLQVLLVAAVQDDNRPHLPDFIPDGRIQVDWINLTGVQNLPHPEIRRRSHNPSARSSPSPGSF